MSYGQSQDYRKEGLFDDILNAELDAEKAQKKMSQDLTTTDLAPLEQRFEPERRDFDAKRAELAAIDPRTIGANKVGQRFAETAATLDAQAKAFIDGAKKEFAPAIEKQRAALKAVQDILAHIIEGPEQLRALCKPIQVAYQLAVNYKAEEERRKLEAAQREAANREREAQIAALRAQAAAQADKAEQARIEHEAQQVAAAPPVPVAVPLAAVAQPKPAGISGTEVFYHEIADWREFCAMLATLQPSITSVQNEAVVSLPGMTIKFNFTQLKRNRTALRGMQVTKGMEVRNRRQ